MSWRSRPWTWLLWHPHQGLWNWGLVEAIRSVIPVRVIHTIIHALIIQLDTCVLFLRAVVRRVRLLGPGRIITTARVPHGISVTYIDLGTHKEAAELSFMVDTVLPRLCERFEAYGFEASRESFEHAAQRFSDRENVRIIHKALCYALPRDSKVRLYKDMGSGLGDSLYRESGSFEEVEAIRLSDFLRDHQIVKDDVVLLLRMNIEGAEYDVIKDLVDSRLARHVDGYFGMWDDLSKMDLGRDEEFRAFLGENRIRTFPFNGRDMRWPLRRQCIAYHVRTHVLRGALRERAASSG